MVEAADNAVFAVGRDESGEVEAATHSPPYVHPGPGVHDARLMLISVCVMSAIVTGLAVFALVHCRNSQLACTWRIKKAAAAAAAAAASSSEDSMRSPSSMSAFSSSASSSPLQCLCCEVMITTNGEFASWFFAAQLGDRIKRP